ncbi:MAG: hypothetical protein RL518_1131, partial [Pseudomonadota bacterium]
WEDPSLAPEERLQAYKDFVREKVAQILAAADRVSSDPAKVLEIRDDPETKRWVAEAQKLKDLSPEDFCKRIDRPEVRELLGKNFLGSEAWRSQGIEVGAEPPIPMMITRELLESECPLSRGQKIKDTHILVLVPEMVNGKPYTALELDKLCETRKGSGNKLIDSDHQSWKENPWASAPQSESEWVLLKRSDREDRDPVATWRHFRLKNIAAQDEVHKLYPEYREVKAIELMTGILLNDLMNGWPRILDGWNLLRCEEPNACGGRVCVGFFSSRGMVVDDYRDLGLQGPLDYGRALARKL